LLLDLVLETGVIGFVFSLQYKDVEDVVPKEVLLSAVYNIKSLIYISIMGVVFTIVFCTVTFSNYMKNIYSPSTDSSEMCDGVLNCVSQLYVSGAIGDTMEEF